MRCNECGSGDVLYDPMTGFAVARCCKCASLDIDESIFEQRLLHGYWYTPDDQAEDDE